MNKKSGGDDRSPSPPNNRHNSKSSKGSAKKTTRKIKNKEVNSPRKIGKRRRRDEAARESSENTDLNRGSRSMPQIEPNTIRFEEDGDEVVFELHGADAREYPSEK